MLPEFDGAEGRTFVGFLQVEEIVGHVSISVRVLGAMHLEEQIVHDVKLPDDGQLVRESGLGAERVAHGLCMQALEAGGGVQRVDLALKHRDQRAKMLERAHCKAPVLVPHVDVHATDFVGVKLEFGNQKFDGPLDMFQSRTTEVENWCYHLDGIPLPVDIGRSTIERNNCPISVHLPFREAFASMAVIAKPILFEDLGHVPTH